MPIHLLSSKAAFAMQQQTRAMATERVFHKAENISSLALYLRKLQTPELGDGQAVMPAPNV